MYRLRAESAKTRANPLAQSILPSAGNDPRGLAERELDSIALSLALEWGEVFYDLMRRGKILALAFIERQTAPLLWARLRLHPPEARQAVIREKVSPIVLNSPRGIT